MGSGYLGDIELKSVQASGLTFKIPSCGIIWSVVYWSIPVRRKMFKPSTLNLQLECSSLGSREPEGNPQPYSQILNIANRGPQLSQASPRNSNKIMMVLRNCIGSTLRNICMAQAGCR